MTRGAHLRSEQVTLPDEGISSTLPAPPNTEAISLTLLELARLVPDLNAASRHLLLEIAHGLRERQLEGEGEACWQLHCRVGGGVGQFRSGGHHWHEWDDE